jgi:NitT/TauT family transport system permease protein
MSAMERQFAAPGGVSAADEIVPFTLASRAEDNARFQGRSDTRTPAGHRAAAPRGRKWRRLALDWALRLSALGCGVLFWQYATAHALHLYVRFDNIPSPVDVATALRHHLAEHQFYRHIAASLRRIAISYGLATAVGIALGLAMARLRGIADIVEPYIEVLRPIPAVAWIPLAILMWPTEEGSIVYITFLGALFPIVLNTIDGVRRTPDVLVRAARSLGAGRASVLWHVVLPAAFPSIRTGMIVGMGVSWFSLLAGEIISGQYGIGYFTWNAYSVIDYPDIVVGMLMIGMLGTLSSYLVRGLTAPLLAWQRSG